MKINNSNHQLAYVTQHYDYFANSAKSVIHNTVNSGLRSYAREASAPKLGR